MEKTFGYELLHREAKTHARLGKLTTTRGEISLPTFMPVGTLGTVKGLTMEMVERTGAEITLANTYHLSLRPGEEVVAGLGGLHAFSGWSAPMLTDSGGFQIFSLAKLTKVTDHAATFRSHIDGREISLTPERSMEIQKALGSDIAMVLDDVVALPSSQSRIEEACDRTAAWAKRCLESPAADGQVRFAIVQGGLDARLRLRSAEQLTSLDFPGFAVGGLSVGEPPEEMCRILDVTCPALPEDKPRYLMGVGRPQDLLHGIARGIDMFDCVMPTRNGRNGFAFTDEGPIKIRNQRFERDSSPLEPDDLGPTKGLTRGYLRHLFMAGEMLGPILLSAHNLDYYQRLMRQAREAIAADSFSDFFEEKMRGWGEVVCTCPLSGKTLR